MIRIGLSVLAVWLAMPALAAAQENTAELVKELLARIDRLEKRVAELERQPGAPTRPGEAVAAAPAAPAVPAAPAAPPPPVSAEAALHQHLGTTAPDQATPNMKIAGFSDFNFVATDQPGFRSGFNEGQFVLHVSSALSPRVNVFGELSFSARADAGTGAPPATGFNAEVERIIVRYDQSDYLKVSFGRYHTPVNWWNTAFHHGQWLQTTVSRPEMTQFGGRFIPVHFVGALVEGAVPAGGLNLNYNFGLGNGRSTVISRGGDAGDVNNNRAWLINAFTRPSRPYGLQFGGSVYRDRITLGAGREFGEWITSAHLVWNKEDPEFIAEAANVNHEPLRGGRSWNSQAYYVQLAYRLPFFERVWKPYYRFEYIHIPRTDPVFTGVPNLAGSVAGVRYDISAFAALKFEYRNQRRRAGEPRVNGAFIQTSFTF